MEKRRHQRMTVPNLHVDISDGQGFFPGTLKDLSRLGLQIDDIPKGINEKAKHFTLIVNGEGKHFKMRTRLRWAQEKSFRKNIGMEIVGAPWGWIEFVMKFEPALDDALAEIAL